MIIKSRSSVIALSMRILLWTVFLIITVPGLTEGPRILIFCVVLFIAVLSGDILKLMINIFNSPQYLELSGNTIVIKPRYRSSFSIHVNELTRISEAKWVKLIASYDRKIIFSNRKLTLYLGNVEFVGLDEFLMELRKLNPQCQLDKYIL